MSAKSFIATCQFRKQQTVGSYSDALFYDTLPKNHKQKSDVKLEQETAEEIDK